MHEIDLNKLDPRTVARVAEYVGPKFDQMAVQTAATLQSPSPQFIPGRGPVSMPMSAPGPSSSGGYNRYREMTLEEMLLENRVVFLIGEINHVSASRVIMQMLYLQSVKRDQEINFYINSPGGVVDDTLAMYDIMRFMNCTIATYCIGRAESGGAIVFMAGTKGKRFILPHAKVMIHQPYGGVYGQTADIEIQAEEILKTKSTLINIMAHHTGKTADQVRQDSERDRFFDAKEAVAYGICDEVIGEDTHNEKAGAEKSE